MLLCSIVQCLHDVRYAQQGFEKYLTTNTFIVKELLAIHFYPPHLQGNPLCCFEGNPVLKKFYTDSNKLK